MKDGRVVLVTGASRGLGRGMAREFGRGGATVYVTSRPQSSDRLSAVADEVVAAGGTGHAVSVDQADPEQVRSLVERITREQGRLDILVNNAASVLPNELMSPKPFWEKSLALADMIDVGLKTNYIMAYQAAPLLIATPGSLLANISFYGSVAFTHGPAYGAAKAGTDKMSFDMAQDFRPFGVSCVSIWPGQVYTDEVAGYVASIADPAMKAAMEARFASFERPEFTARVIAALHDDPELAERSGLTLIGAELGTRYGITDVDGRTPASLRETMGGPPRFVVPDAG